MCITSIIICLSCILVRTLGTSIPPAICFEPFNGKNCGTRPLHVLYYYKPGSRCELGIWRGCPTQNIFKDEYECINTCIYTERAKVNEYHTFDNDYDNNMYQLPDTEMEYGGNTELQVTTVAANGSEIKGAAAGNGEGDGEETAAAEGGETEGAEGKDATGADGEDADAEANPDADNGDAGGDDAEKEPAGEGEEDAGGDAAETTPAEDAEDILAE